MVTLESDYPELSESLYKVLTKTEKRYVKSKGDIVDDDILKYFELSEQACCRDGNSNCMCNVPIVKIFHITHIKSGEDYPIGSTCIKKFYSSEFRIVNNNTEFPELVRLKFCKDCDKKLNNNNKSGYCGRHNPSSMRYRDRFY